MKKNLHLPKCVRNLSTLFLERNLEKLILEKDKILKPDIRITLQNYLLKIPPLKGSNNIVSVLTYKSYIYTGMSRYVYTFALKGKPLVSKGILRVDKDDICSNHAIYFIVNTIGFMYKLSAKDSFQGFNYTKRNDYYTISETLHLES